MKSLKHIIIYSVLSAKHVSGVTLGNPFETLLEVRSAVVAIHETSWNGFGSSFLEKCIFQ